MDFMGPVFVALIGKLDATNIILLILLLGCAWWHYVRDKQNREDRQASIASNEKLSEALNGIKNVISAQSGRVL